MGRPRKPWPPTFDPSDADKTCTRCGGTFPTTTEFFYRNASKPTGWEVHCKGCGRAARRKSHFKHHEKNLERLKSPQARFQQIRNGARQRDLDWELSFEDVEGFWDQPCHYCGDEIDTVGLDRVDNSQGYVLSNVVPCCGTCNIMRGSLTVEDWFAHMKKVIHRALEE